MSDYSVKIIGQGNGVNFWGDVLSIYVVTLTYMIYIDICIRKKISKITMGGSIDLFHLSEIYRFNFPYCLPISYTVIFFGFV